MHKRLVLPRRVIINDVKYKITSTRQYPEDEHVHGRCYLDKKVLYICPEQDTHEKACTLFHELTHAIFHEYKIRPRMDYSPYYEKTVQQIEDAKMQVFRDNPKVAAYILLGAQES